jgi:tetratricopeptide (TPR) repeat protein
MDQGEDRASNGQEHTNNQMDVSGDVGDFVQAREVHGGIHFHPPGESSFSVIPQQLPGLERGFVNRRTELDRLARIIEMSDVGPLVVVITGTAGVGKTSLALRWAHSLRDQYPDGQLYINLHGYDPSLPVLPNHALGRFLRDLGVPTAAIPHELDDRAVLLRSVLAVRRVLIVLDNASTVQQVRPLLPGSRECLVIITSRSRLSGLVIREGAARIGLDLLGNQDAVNLLRAVIEGYRDHDDHTDVMELAGLCARLPLALKIAAERAARYPRMRLSELIADLRHESGNLWNALTPDGDDDAEAVRTVFAWSYRALSPQAAQLFSLLGLHPGDDFSVPAAAALTSSKTPDARRNLEALVGAQLIEHSGQGRYQFHDLLRAYAVDQLEQQESTAVAAAVERVLSWYLHTADAAQHVIAPFDSYTLADEPAPGVVPLTFESYADAIAWYRTESQNIVAATRRARERGHNAIAWRFAAVLRAIYMHQNSFDDWMTVGSIGLEAAVDLGDDAAEIEALDTLARAFFQARMLDEATAHHARLLALRQRLGDRFGEGKSVNALGLLALRRRQLDVAEEHFSSGADIFASLGERRLWALLRTNLAEALADSGSSPGRAIDLARDALETLRGLQDRAGVGNGLFTLAKALRTAGRLADAETAIAEALAIAEQDDNDLWRAHWLSELATIQLEMGRPSEALAAYHRAAVLQRRLGDRSREAMALDRSGSAFRALGNYEEAAKFHRRAIQVHAELEDRWQRAIALHHLATALHLDGEIDQAHQHWRAAHSLLTEFADDAAAATRDAISASLGGIPPESS